MAMASGSDFRGISSDINVTPLIDVLLVLLIIFMVIVPAVPKGLSATVPQPSTEDAPSTSIVVSVLSAGPASQVSYKINQEAVAKGNLLARLTAIYTNRADRIMFVKGDNDVDYAQVAEVIDLGHSAGVDHVGLMTPGIASGR